jgi:glutamate-1-semialdehyde 2,1-aminomutase
MSAELFRRAQKLFPRGVNSPVRFYEPYPIYIKSGRGSKITDVDGKEYVDYVLAYGPLILGHSNPKVVEKVKEKVGEGTIYGAPTEAEVEFGELVKNASGIDRMRIVNSGTEATMHAIRLAMHATRRKKILKINGGYHGTHPFNFPSDSVDTVDFNSSENVRAKLATREFACLIVEPVMGNIGVIPPEDGFLEEISQYSEDSGSCLIMDEVITGFRTGFFPYYRRKKVVPDLVTFGKIVGGGLPLALFGGKEELMKKVRPEGDFQQAGTYSANPISVTAGLETLKILSKTDYGKLKELTGIAVKELSSTDLTVNFETGMLSIFFSDKPVRNARDAQNTRKDLYPELFRRALQNGIFLPPSFDETIFLSFSHGRDEVAAGFAFLAEEGKRLWKGS